MGKYLFFLDKILDKKFYTLILFVSIPILALFLIFIKDVVYAGPPPSISSVDLTATACSSTIANSVTSARVGDTITINGSNFGSTQGSTTITINGSAPTNTNYTWSASSISGVVVPMGTITGNISINIGNRSATFSFTINPCITSISPTSGGIGTSITINGSEFGASPGAGNYDTSSNNINLGGTAVPTGDVTSWSNTQIVFSVPSGVTSGSNNLYVVAGSISSNTVTLTILPPPNSPATLTQSLLGGTLSANTYYYEVAAVTSYGQTTLSSAVSIATTGSTSENKVSWNPVTGATSYNIYRGIGSSTMTQYINTTNSYLLDTGNLNWIPVGNNNSLNSSAGLFQTTYYATSVEYNGYVYEIGGENNAGTTLSTVDYAQILPSGDLGPWIATSPIPLPLNSATSVVYNGYVYEIGGCTDTSCSTSTNAVYYAPILSSGALGSWTTTTALPSTSAIDSSTTVAYNGYIYEIGGYVGTSAVTTVYYIAINSNGTLGSSWTTTTALPVKMDNSTSIAYNGYIYAIGGYNGSAPVTTVNSIPINSNGTLGSSWTATTSLQVATYNSTSVEYGGYIYEIGGFTTAATASVYYISIVSGGTLGSSWTVTTPLSTALYGTTSVVGNGYVYDMGGYTGSVAVSTVGYATINSNGTLGASWINPNNAVPASILYSTSVEYNGYIYDIGGLNGSTYLSSVYYSQINSQGVPGVWATATNALPVGLDFATSVVYNGYIYEIGGSTSSTATSSAVYYSQIGAGGAPGAWATATNTLPAPINSSTAVEYGGYIYELGGYNGTTSARVSTIYYSQIGTGGAPGVWATATNSLPAAQTHDTSVAYNGYIYVIGGFTGSYLNTVSYSQIGTGGTPGTWTTSTNTLPNNVDYVSSVVYNGYIYEIGGFTGSVYLSTINFSLIGSGGAPGTWVTSTNPLPQTIDNSNAVLYNGYVYIIGGYDGTYTYQYVLFSYLNVLPTTNTAYTDTNQNTITWNAVSGATSYKVYKGSSSGGETTYLLINNSNTTTFVDSGYNTPSSGSPPTTGGTAPTIASYSTAAVGGDIPYNTTYYYKVTATTSSGETLPSSEVTITANGTIATPGGVAVSTSSVASSSITSGAWLNHNNINLSATMSSPNNPDTLYLLVEVQPNGTAFTNSTSNFVTSGVGVYKSSAYSYSGTSLVANIVISGLASNTQYHWQAAVMGVGGASSWVAMGGNPDFGIDTSSPISGGTNVIAWSGQPTALFSNGFESGTILTTSSPAGGFTSDGGSSLPLIQNNIQGPVLQGTYSVNMATSSAGTSYIANNTFNTSSAQVRMYIDVKAIAFAAVGDSITLMSISGSSGTIATLNILDTSSGPVLQATNSVGTTSAQGTTILPLNTWNVIVFDLSINGTTGSIYTYLNGTQQLSLTSQNTGVSNMTTLTLGAVTDSTSDSINMNMDSINVEDTAGLTQLAYGNPTPYKYTTPYFEFLGGYDQGSGILNYGVYFGQTATDYPVSTQTNQGYLSPSLTTGGMYYLNVVLYDNVGNTSMENVNFEYNFTPPVTSGTPNSPTSLEQLQSNGTTQIANDTWTTSGITTNVVFQFSMSSPNSTDTLTPEIELQPNGTAFTGTPNYSGSALSYSGTAVTGIVDVTGLTNCTGYHWQAFVKNSNGISSPVVFNSTTPNFSVSNSAPTAGTVYDGSVTGTETNTTASISSLGANWTGFSDTCSGLAPTPYTVAVGTTPGGYNIYAYSSSSVVLNNPSPYNTISLSSLPLHTGQIYYVSVQAINNVGLTTTVTSSGQYVVPTLSFSLNSSLVNLGNWNSTNSYTTTNTSTLSVLTDAYNGYTISAYETSLLTSIENSSYTIPNFSAGSYASPALWPSGDYGFGYTSSATDINGVNLFSNGTLYAPFSQSGPGDVVAENQTNITGSNYSTTPTTYTITYKAAVQASQQAGSYQTNIVYTVVSSF